MHKSAGLNEALSAARIAARNLRRAPSDPRQLVVAVAVLVAVAAVTSVELFTDRVERALARESGTLIAADLAVIGGDPLPDSHRALAASFNLKTSGHRTLRTVASHGDTFQLVQLKAVEPGYPLRGEVKLRSTVDGPETTATTGPDAGTAWIDGRLQRLLDLAPGDVIRLGTRDFAVARLISHEPDGGGALFSVGPRVMIADADLESTGLVVTGSRTRYTLLLAGPEDNVAAYARAIDVGPGERLVTPGDARPQIATALERTRQFLSLSAFAALILAGVAIALAARSFAAGQADTVALLQTMGASPRQVVAVFVVQVSVLGLLAALGGGALGYAAQALLAQLGNSFVDADDVAPRLLLAAKGMVQGMVALYGFALPPLLQLRRVPPLRVIRRDAAAARPGATAVAVYAVTALVIVMPWQHGAIDITLWTVGALVVAFVALGLAAWALTTVAAAALPRYSFTLRHGLRHLTRRGRAAVFQIAGMALGLAALLLMWIVQADLVADWRASLPVDAADHFVLNIQADELTALDHLFTTSGGPSPRFYPAVRGRLTAIGDRAVQAEDFEDPGTRRLVNREFNLSWTDALQPDNRVVAGTWLDPEFGSDQFSVERSVAERLGVELGDRLTFQVADRSVTATVTSLRAVEWDTMRVNFFVIAPPGLLDDRPTSYITAFPLDRYSDDLPLRLVREFPSLSVIDVRAVLAQLRTIMARATLMVQVVFAFALVAGLLVLVAAVESTQRERIFESVLLKTLGADRGQIARILGAEFAVIVVIAGSVAGCLAVSCAWVLATRVIHLPYSPDAWPLLLGIVIAAVTVGPISAVSLGNALRQPAAGLLRRLG